MGNGVEPGLREETASWRDRTAEAVESPPVGFHRVAELVREGILLRRRWDQADPEAPARRELLRLLPAAQTLAQRRLADEVEDRGHAEPELIGLVVGQLREDDRYLVSLLNDYPQSPESAAFAVECFRDDLHWLGTQVAVLDGSRGVDFLGRVLLEEEALEREIESWEHQDRKGPPAPEATIADSTTAASNPHPQEPSAEDAEREAGASRTDGDTAVRPVLEELRAAARRLRATALARQVESLSEEAEPRDARGWYRTWQAAGRLAMRLDPDLLAATAPGEEPKRQPAILIADAQQSVEEIRKRAAQRWNDALGELPPESRQDALQQAADELRDAGKETLTFLDDLSLPDAVRSLEILDEDVRTFRQAVTEHATAELRGLRWALRWDQAAVAGELQERRIAWRMEGLFGRWFVTALERSILLLLLLFVVMLIAEGPLMEYEAARTGPQAAGTGHGLVETVFAWTDLGICVVFLSEFCLKLLLARRRGLYFWRNWLTGLLPSIPFGFIGYAAARLAAASQAEGLLLLRFLRYLRLPRMARWLRIARPVLRLLRVVGFLLRASDRLVRQLSPLLNRNLLFFERAAVTQAEPPYRTELAALRERFYYRAAETVAWLPPSARCGLVKSRIGDLSAMLSSPRLGLATPVLAAPASTARELLLEEIIGRLVSATPAGISDRIGRTLAQSVTRWCRALDVFAVRRLPVVHDLVAASRLPSPYDTTARVANRIGLLLNQLLDRIYWMADLYGTVTPPQLVDSLGEYMVKGTARPARRLLMFGLGFLAVSQLALLCDVAWLDRLAETLRRLVAGPLLVLGGICAVPLLVGVWFRQIAGEATEFYRQVAEAQFITATKKIKRYLSESQREFLHRRVIAPEMEMAEDAGPSGAEKADTARVAAERLWEEYLDGPPFHHSDTGTTNHLLGNLALVSLRETRLRYTQRQRKSIRRLDLANTRLSLRGPYLWFHFISRSLAHHTAKLVENYNAFALPLSRAATAEDAEVRSYVRWLEKRLGTPAGQIELPPPFRQRLDAMPTEPNKAGGEDRRCRSYQGNDFTAIHFLSDDADVEADIRRRYGDLLADLMCRDRRDNFRRVFRTYPFHRWPRERRTFNPLSLYERHLAGGRVLLLPLKILVWAAVLLARAVRLVWSVVREVRNPSVRELASLDEADPFAVARRKIHRMRKPVFMECLRMRAEFDPEYLGIVPPGASGGVRESSHVQIEDDLARIGAVPSVRRRFRQMATRRRRQMLDFRTCLDRFGEQSLPSESLRAMAIAYTIDCRGARSRLEDATLLEQAFDEAIVDRARPRSARTLPGWSLASLWCALWTWRRLRRLLRQPMFAHYDRAERAACRRCVRRRRGAPLAALRRLTRGGPAGVDPVGDAWKELSAVGRDPETWTRQLVILRAVQTLSVLDLDTYSRLVYELGGYESSTDEGIRGLTGASPLKTEGP